MQAAYIDAVGRARVGTAETPRLDDDEVLIRVRSAGICGTDLHILKGEFIARYPLIPGHEFCGDVVEVGKAVTTVGPGDRVAASPIVSCGFCEFCRTNRQIFCKALQAYGVTMPGGFEDYVKVRAQNVYPIGDLTYDEGALIEPFACVVHGLDTVGVASGDEVLVVGAGPIGLLLMQTARLCGARWVVVADLIGEKLAKAQELGADETFVADGDLKEKLLASHPDGFDLTIDATGNPAAQEQLPRFTKSTGRVLFFGVAPPGATIRVEPYDIFLRELKIVGAFGFIHEYGKALALARAGRVNLKGIISHHFPLGEFARAMETALGPDVSRKILLHPEGDS